MVKCSVVSIHVLTLCDHGGVLTILSLTHSLTSHYFSLVLREKCHLLWLAHFYRDSSFNFYALLLFIHLLLFHRSCSLLFSSLPVHFYTHTQLVFYHQTHQKLVQTIRGLSAKVQPRRTLCFDLISHFIFWFYYSFIYHLYGLWIDLLYNNDIYKWIIIRKYHI